MRIFFIETSSIKTLKQKQKAFIIAESREAAIYSFCEKFNYDKYDIDRCYPISDNEDILFKKELL